MASYLETRDYFKALAEEHPLIKHFDEQKKKFFQTSMEEVLFGTVQDLPGPDEGPFLMYVGYMNRLGADPIPQRRREIMFFIMQQCGNKDYEQESEAADITEKVVEDFIRRFKKDSEEDSAIWEYSFDAIPDTSVNPHDFMSSNVKFRGWQVVVTINNQFNDCYDENAWTE